MKKQVLTACLLPGILASVLVGCTPNAAPEPSNQAKIRNARDGVVRDNDLRTPPAEANPSKQDAPTQNQPSYTQRAPQIQTKQPGEAGSSARDQANEIASMVTRIPGVERAAVFLAGKTALVGIDMQAQITGSKIDTIKYSVKEAVEREGQGYNAVVSSDIDTITRVRELVNGARQGRPIDAITNEIADIVARLLPEV